VGRADSGLTSSGDPSVWGPVCATNETSDTGFGGEDGPLMKKSRPTDAKRDADFTSKISCKPKSMLWHSRASDAVRWRSSDAGHQRPSDAASDEVRWRASDALHPRVFGASEAPLLTELFGKPQIQPLTISASQTDPIPCMLLAISATETFFSPRELCSVDVVDTTSANRVGECFLDYRKEYASQVEIHIDFLSSLPWKRRMGEEGVSHSPIQLLEGHKNLWWHWCGKARRH